MGVFIVFTGNGPSGFIGSETISNAATYTPFYTPFYNNSSFTLMKMFVENRIYNTSYGDMMPLISANAPATKISIIYKRECGRLTYRTVQPSKNEHLTKTIIVYKTGDHYDACLPRLSARAKSMDQRPVTTFPLAEGSCNIMQSPDKLGAKVDHDSGVLTDMNCTLTTKTSGGLLQFLNILTYISNFNASENIFTNFLNYDFTKGDKSFLKELNDFRIKHAKI